MNRMPWMAALMLAALGSATFAQTPPAKPPAAQPPVAATVNSQPIPEHEVRRMLDRVPAEKQAEVRPEILDYLIDNMLIDQYMAQQKVTIEKKDVDARFDQIKADMKKQGQTFEEMLKQMKLTEEEIRTQITCDMRWEKFAGQYATEKALKDMFTQFPEMFDGAMVHARHILVIPAASDPKGPEQAKAQLLLLRKQIEDEVTKGMAKVPPQTDNLGKEQARAKLLEEDFAAVARAKSACPSKGQGGDVGWFPRLGSMVEPFAKAAFALKPYQMSDVVVSQFGCHLILVVDRKPGREVKFEDLKEEVKEVFGERMRQDICAQLRARSKIVITPVK